MKRRSFLKKLGISKAGAMVLPGQVCTLRLSNPFILSVGSVPSVFKL